jgi:hypothetical protein
MPHPVPRPGRRFALQWRPNWIRPERRLVLFRLYWERGTCGDGKGYSAKLSLSLCLSWRSLFVGLSLRPEWRGFLAWLCVVPCLPLRLHLVRSYGGRLF